MDIDSFRNYILQISSLLKENARRAKLDADRSDEADSVAFDSGFLMAYHEVISIMKNQAPFFDLKPKDIGLEDINPERDLL